VAAALEFACLDLLGQAWNAPVSEILGGRLREQVELDALRADLEGVVRETVQPEHVSLWLSDRKPVTIP